MSLTSARLALRATTVLALLCLGATPANAHEAEGLAGGFVAGIMHPLAGPDHLLAMVAVGIWGAFLRRPLIVLVPIVFPTIMALGAALGMSGVPVPPVEVGIAVSVIVLGSAIALAWRAPVGAAVTIVAIFGSFHGYAHGRELPSMADPIAFSLGFVAATGALHLAGIGLGLLHARPGGVSLTRLFGAMIAFAGLWYLAQAVGR